MATKTRKTRATRAQRTRLQSFFAWRKRKRREKRAAKRSAKNNTKQARQNRAKSDDAKARQQGKRRRYRRHPGRGPVASTREHELSDDDFTDVPTLGEKISNVLLLKPNGTRRFMPRDGQQCLICGGTIKRDEVEKHYTEVHGIEMTSAMERPKVTPKADPTKVKPAKQAKPTKPKNEEWRKDILSMSKKSPEDEGTAARIQAAENTVAAFRAWAANTPRDLEAMKRDAALMADTYHGLADAMRLRIRTIVERPPRGLGLSPTVVGPLEDAAAMLAKMADYHIELVARIQRRYDAIITEAERGSLDFFANRG